jgi:hypothetical protein
MLGSAKPRHGLTAKPNGFGWLTVALTCLMAACTDLGSNETPVSDTGGAGGGALGGTPRTRAP